MTIHTDAIYEAGVLRPLAPLSLQEHKWSRWLFLQPPTGPLAEVRIVRDHSAFLNSYVPEEKGCTMTIRPGEFWVADIPYTSGRRHKKRPVLVLWLDGADAVVASRDDCEATLPG